jgi:hypothetical protein
MSLTSLLQDKGSWLNAWIRDTCNVKNAETAAGQLNGKLETPMGRIYNSDLMLVGLSMVYAIGDMLDPTLEWLKTSSIQYDNADSLMRLRKEMGLPEWAMHCAGLESAARAGKRLVRPGQLALPSPTVLPTLQDITRLCNDDWLHGGDELVSPGKPLGLRQHQTFHYSEEVGGADCQFSMNRNTLIRVKTTFGRVMASDLYQTAIYAALDDEPDKWKTFFYLLPRQQGVLKMDIKKLWAHIGFNPKAFIELLDSQPEDEGLEIMGLFD